MTSDPPKAFLSYSTADQRLAERLAQDLTNSGIQVWWARWEIKPGDSLRRKIDEGIEGAAYFMVLLTPNSLKSEWVQTELDAGMVRRIEGSCRLIPIIHKLRTDEVPITLRGLRWVKLDDYDAGIRELVNACLELETKPPLGSRPLRGLPSLPAELDLSVNAQRLAVLLSNRSKEANTNDPLLEAAEVLEAIQITANEWTMAVDELEEHGLVIRHLGQTSFGRVSPTPNLFFGTDAHVKGWNPKSDAHALAAFLVNRGTDLIRTEDADQQLKWGPRRMNPAANFLVFHDLAKGHERQAGANPYAFYYLQVTPRTKRFALE